MDSPSNNQIWEWEEDEEEVNRRNIVVLATCTATVHSWLRQATVVIAYLQKQERRMRRIRDIEQHAYLSALTGERESKCVSQLRLMKDNFDLICNIMQTRGLLRDTTNTTVEEQVALFLHTIAHSVRNQTNSSRFMRSGETISVIFMKSKQELMCWFLIIEFKLEMTTLGDLLDLRVLLEH